MSGLAFATSLVTIPGRADVVVVGTGAGSFRIWKFETRVVSSQFDGGPTLLIDYAIAKIPDWLRHGLFDELRRLRDGLYLGKGGLQALGKHRFVFHWALARA